MDPLKTLETLMNTGLQAANPFRQTYENLPKLPRGRVLVVAVGKAASPMAEAAASYYEEGSYSGFLYAPEGYGVRVKGLLTFEGTHPKPSRKNVEITQKIMREVEALSDEDLLLALISGGTSALLCAPQGCSLEDKIRETEDLLKSGRPVTEINKRRKELSAVKGGKLADLAAPARVVTLVVSDVAGDDPRVVGSGPTVREKRDATVILTADFMLGVIRHEAELMGVGVTNFGQCVGKARDLARTHARIALKYSGKRPHLFISGGETSVTVTGSGAGGRNTEYALGLAEAVKSAPGIYGLAVDTDGHDGTGPFAGARFGSDILEDVNNLEKYIKNNDSGSFFKVTGGLINTGPTLTNLNDLRMILLV